MYCYSDGFGNALERINKEAPRLWDEYPEFYTQIALENLVDLEMGLCIFRMRLN